MPIDPPSDLRRRERALSPIVLRILAVNVMALAILVGSLLYLGRYQERIVANELDAMLLQSRIIASAVSEGAIVIDDDERSILSPLLSRLMIRRLGETAEMRTRLYDAAQTLLADSRLLLNNSARIEVENLDPAAAVSPTWIERSIAALFDSIDLIRERRVYPLYNEQQVQHDGHFEIVGRAIQGEKATQVWSLRSGGLLLAVAVPVEHEKRVVGSVMMSRNDAQIDQAIYAVRLDILRIFLITLCITILLSLYLARAIARPIRHLAQAAEGLRHGQAQSVGFAGTSKLLRDAIPDMTARGDEIGDLSGALRALTEALAQRLGAIENFAADVAHELKNPLTSLRSAVETAERVQDPAAQRKLMLVIRDDVNRLDRLISDISNASRLDAELSRAEAEPIEVGKKLAMLADYYHQSAQDGAPRAEVVLRPMPEPLWIKGVDLRLVQVFQNLIDNALSFSPSDGKVVLAGERDGRAIKVSVEDNGPGIPENKLEAIFDRFYTERPKTEKFGTHSGLGLSISKQIVEAHRGRIWAENRRDAAGNVIGARFVVRLPGMERP
jgi:two-component system sensor histidine kinase ChvG